MSRTAACTASAPTQARGSSCACGLVGITAGPLLERAFIRRVADRGEVISLILTFALFLILEDVMKLVWGVDPYLADMPYSMLGAINLAGVNYPFYQLLLPFIALL